MQYTITGEMLTRLSRKLSIITCILLVGVVSLILERTRRIYEAMIRHFPIPGDSLKGKCVNILRHFSHGFHSLKSPGSLAMIFFYSLIIWALVGFSLQVMSWGFEDLSLNFYHGMAIMIIICIAIMIPAAPGYWGLYECGGIFALIALGIAAKEEDQASAAGFTLMIHTLQIIPIVLVGLFYLWKENISLKQMEARTISREEGRASGNPS